MELDALVAEVVAGLFKDIRDRRLLKWLFPADGSMVPILHDQHGEPLLPIEPDVQEEIRQAWAGIIAARLLDALEAERSARVRLEEALRKSFCPRPCNNRPDYFEVGQCVDAGECGCSIGEPLSHSSSKGESDG